MAKFRVREQISKIGEDNFCALTFRTTCPNIDAIG